MSSGSIQCCQQPNLRLHSRNTKLQVRWTSCCELTADGTAALFSLTLFVFCRRVHFLLPGTCRSPEGASFITAGGRG
jgi:hypothetical protein